MSTAVRGPRFGLGRLALALTIACSVSGAALGQVDGRGSNAPGLGDAADGSSDEDDFYTGLSTAADAALDAPPARDEKPPPLPEPDDLERSILGTGSPEPKRRARLDRDLENLPSLATDSEVCTEEILAVHIAKRSAAIRSGDTQAAELELGLIEELRLALAARNIIVVSAQLIQEAKVAMELGQFEVAAKRADAASRLSPDMEAAHWMRARVHWQRDKASAPLALEALRDLLSVRFRIFRNQVSFLLQALALLGLALASTVLAFAVLQLLKYVRYPAHDLSRKVPGFVGGGELTIFLLVSVLLPFGLGFGLAPSVAMSLALVAGYQTTGERALSWGLMLIVAAAPLGLFAASPLLSFYGSSIDAMAEATSEAFARDAEAVLRHKREGTDSYASAMVLAHRARTRGDARAAEKGYRAALESRPDDPVAWNNLGVALLAESRNDEAEDAFKSSVAKGGEAAPHFNLALLMAERGAFEQSAKSMNRAREFDEKLVARRTLMAGALSRKAAISPFDQELLWKSLFALRSQEGEAITVQLWRPMSGRLHPWVASVVVLLVTMLGALVARRAESLSAGCPRCGLPANRDAKSGLCDQCSSVFLSRAPVDLGLRSGKERAIQRYQWRLRWSERALAVIAGAGHVIGGRPLVGVFALFFFALTTIVGAFGEQFFVHPWSVYVDDSARQVKVALAVALCTILSAWSLRSTFGK